jgi:2-octaprenyl-6-methoxyphenol hydroxylase
VAIAEDIVIAGAGPVGAVCALALKQGGLNPLVLEARTIDMPVNDKRTLALSYGSRLILERLGVWTHLGEATPITRIHISHKGGLGRAVLGADEEGIPALGYVLAYGELHHALATALGEAGVNIGYGTPVEDILPGAESATVKTGGEHPRELAARLAITADGGRGGNTGQPMFSRDYHQIAIVADVTTELPHQGLAYERFTPDGPVALLPKGSGFSLVWVNPPGKAEHIMTLDDAGFLAVLQAHFGGRQGRFVSTGPRARFPLKLDYRGVRAGERIVRIGNASQTLHPVAGQGFNLGLRDAWELAQSCLDTSAESLGSQQQLKAFAASRRKDALPGIGFTDVLVKSFSNANPLLHHLRGVGLMALQALPPARHFVARRMLFGRHG